MTLIGLTPVARLLVVGHELRFGVSAQRGPHSFSKRKLTVHLDEHVITQAKVLAARRGTSVSAMVAAELERLVADDDRYEDAHRRAQRALAGAMPRGGDGGLRPLTVLVFVDTNVLAYAHDSSDPRRHAIASSILEELSRTRTGVLSTQVLAELYVVVRQKFDPPTAQREARALVDAYAAWPLVQVDPLPIVVAPALEERHSPSFWDALIIEAARRAGADRLLSEDLQHGRRIAALTIENPFAAGLSAP